MDDNKSALRLYIFSSGARLGVILVAFFIVLYITGNLFGSNWRGLTWLIYPLIIYTAMIGYRQRFLNGIMSYGKGLVFGLKMGLLSGVIVGFFYFVLLKVVDPGLKDVFVAEAEEAYLAIGFSEAFVEQLQDSIQKAASPWTLLISNIFNGVFNGLFFSLIVAAFVKRKGDNPFNDAMKNVE
jgi:hypothetical protein